MKNAVQITWLGHSCFLLEAEDYRIVADPYADLMVPGLGKLEIAAHEITCSHEHEDHCAKQVVTLLKKTQERPFTITTLESYHDHEQGEKRGKNRITIFIYKDLKIVHFGDQGCLPTVEQCNQLKNADVVMIPVGGFYTIDAREAKQIIDAIQPKVVIPMHYRSDTFGFDQIAKLDEFLKMTDNSKQYLTPTIKINKDIEKQTALLSL